MTRRRFLHLTVCIAASLIAGPIVERALLNTFTVAIALAAPEPQPQQRDVGVDMARGSDHSYTLVLDENGRVMYVNIDHVLTDIR
jgi:hypothetical protein